MRQRSSGRAPESFTILNLYKWKFQKSHTCCKPQFCFLVYRQPANFSDEPLEDICSTTDLMHDILQEDKVQTECCKSFCTHPIRVPSPRTLEAASETRVFSVHCLNLYSYIVPEVFTHNIENEGFQRQFFPTQFQGRGRGNRHRLVQ